MPHALIPLNDVYESVIRPVAINAVNQLAIIMRLPDDTNIRLPGHANTVPMNGGDFKPCDHPGVNFPGASNRLIVEFTEETSEDHTLSTPVNRPQHLPLFEDAIRGVSIYPVYRHVKMTLSIRYTAPNQTLVQRWLDEMRTRVSMMRAELYQTLQYHYAIPTSAMVLLGHLHEMKEASAVPDGDTFAEWLDTHLHRPTTTTTTLDDRHPQRVIKEQQLEILGWFDFTDAPQAPQPSSNENGTWNADITYTFGYDRPTQVYCRWPLVIHNQPIEKAYRPVRAYETFRQHPRRMPLIKGSLRSLRENMRFHGIPYIHHPDIDDWTPSKPPSGIMTFFSGLLVVNPDMPRQLTSLFDLGPFTFTPYFLEYFYQQQHTLFKATTSPFSFHLYQNDRHMSEVTLSFVEGSVTLQTDQDLDLRYQYHLQIGIKRNWRHLDVDTLTCLRRYPLVTYVLLRALGVKLGGADQYQDLGLLGDSRSRPPSVSCPGQGSLLGPPENGGTWPWPWLGNDWDDTPWPGYNWADTDNPSGWPGGSPTYNPPVWPTWPGSIRWEYPDTGGPGPNGSWPGTWPDGSNGIIPNKDMQDAVDRTDDIYGGRPPGGHGDTIGPITVMYGEILTFKNITSEEV